ncbi:DUF3662 domain-containing protein, partial [Streptomyces prunicolor]|uniref:DUF3662 domain-containing protein n=1 Tax=Streptomyces prunicolor TaxID=67348 RepID=UPI0033DE7D13
MGVLKKFEQRLEGLVNGTFAKVFKSEVQPVEIAGALQRECDNNATIWNRDRTVVPNDFIVELSTPDFERLSPYSGQLGDELAGMVRDYAKQQLATAHDMKREHRVISALHPTNVPVPKPILLC